MGEIKVLGKLFGEIKTENGLFYVKEYYSNGYVVRFSLTDNEEEQLCFSGEHISGPGVTEKDGDVYRSGPNYGPFMSVRDVLRSKEMEYLGFKSITVMLEDFEGNVGGKYNLPPHYGKYRGITGKKAEVTDLVNGIKTEFLVTSDYINKLKNKLNEQQTLVFEKIGTMNKLPEGCVVPETRDKAFEPFNYYSAIGYCKRIIESDIPVKKITPKQIPHVAKFLGVSDEEVSNFNVFQGMEILDKAFNWQEPELDSDIEELKEHYLKLMSKKAEI